MNKSLIIIVAIAALAIGVFLGARQSGPDLSELSGFSFPEPKVLRDVDLLDHNNEAFTESNFKDKWTFIYVGFSFCPDVCPMTLTTLNQMYSQLSEADLSNDVSTLLVSVDPERDTTERLKDYVKYFNESFTGVTGTPEELRKFAEQVSVVYSIPKDRSDANYLVDHSSTVILINPDGAVQAIFSPPQTADALAKDFRLLVAHYNSF